MTVLFQYGTTAAGVIDYRINAGELLAEGGTIRGGELLRRLDEAGVIVQRAATLLRARYPHVAAVALEDASGGQRRLREKRISGAADEQGHARPPRALGRQQLRQPAMVRCQSRNDVVHASQRGRQQPAHAVNQSAQPQTL